MFTRIATLSALTSLRPVLAIGALVIIGVAAFGQPTNVSADTSIDLIAIDTNIAGNVATLCEENGGDPDLDYPCNASTVLGPIDQCLSLPSVGSTAQIDIVGFGIPLGGANQSNTAYEGVGMSGMALDWVPNGPTGPFRVSARTASSNLVHQGVGDNPVTNTDALAGAGSSSGHWKWSDADVNANLVGEGGQGIAMRLTITAINPGVATLSLGVGGGGVTQPTWTDTLGNEYSVDQYQSAMIVVGSPCPSAPVGGIVELPVGPDAASSWTPLAISLMAAIMVLATAGWYARRRFS